MPLKIFKKATCSGLSLILALTLPACGSSGDIPMASKENIYAEEEITLPEGISNATLIGGDGENIYLSGNSGDGFESLYTLDMAGNLINENKLSEGRYIQASAVDADGYLWTAEMVSAPFEPESAPDEAPDGEFVVIPGGGNFSMRGQGTLYFVKYDKTGEVVSEIPSPDLGANGFINGFAIGGDGNIYVVSSGAVCVIDPSGALLFKIGGEETGGGNFNLGGGNASFITGIYRTKSGEVAALENKMEITDDGPVSRTVFNIIDTAAQGYGMTYESSAQLGGTVANGAAGHDVLLSDASSLKGYDFETDAETTIIDWLQSGVDGSLIRSPLILPDGRILCASSDFGGIMSMSGGMFSFSISSGGRAGAFGGSDMKLSLFTKTDPSGISDKKLITLAVIRLDNTLKNAVVDFNKTNGEYSIEVISYADDGDYQSAITKLNNDIISGNIPDILALNGSMPIDSYISKGILADIYQFIDKDENIKKEDYLQNVLDAYSSGGKLYGIVPSFTIQTVVIRQEDAGGKTSWNMSEFTEFAAANPEENIFSRMTKESFLTSAMNYSSGSYINRETGECSFDSEDFISLLKFADIFPSETEESEAVTYFSAGGNRGGGAGTFGAGGFEIAGGPGGGVMRMQRRGLDALLSSEYINRFIAVREFEQAVFAEPITFIGFPGANGNGSSISADLELAITAKAKNPDGAWEFCKYFLSDEYQDSVEYSFPIKLTALNALKEAAMEKPYYMEGDEKIEYENTYRVDMRTEIEIGENSEADSEKMMELITAVSEPQRYDTTLSDIILEEAGAFFAGQKTAEEAAGIIQNRASTYISENR